jgi:hypothetical protein
VAQVETDFIRQVAVAQVETGTLHYQAAVAAVAAVQLERVQMLEPQQAEQDKELREQAAQ